MDMLTVKNLVNGTFHLFSPLLGEYVAMSMDKENVYVATFTPQVDVATAFHMSIVFVESSNSVQARLVGPKPYHLTSHIVRDARGNPYAVLGSALVVNMSKGLLLINKCK
jgi:hypothetical protein